MDVYSIHHHARKMLDAVLDRLFERVSNSFDGQTVFNDDVQIDKNSVAVGEYIYSARQSLALEQIGKVVGKRFGNEVDNAVAVQRRIGSDLRYRILCYRYSAVCIGSVNAQSLLRFGKVYVHHIDILTYT